MRITILQLALLLVAAPAGAQEIVNFWSGKTDVGGSFPAHTFRIATSETAYIEHAAFAGAPNPSIWTAASGPNVAALIADLTNGVNNPITWTGPGFSYTMDENRFFTMSPSAAPLIGASGYFAQPKVDLAGAEITEIWLSANVLNYSVATFGRLPEPTSAALLLFGLCGGALHRSGRPRYQRRNVRKA